jgi:hypothetical protein
MPKALMVKTSAAILIAALATSAWATACFDDENLQALDFQQGQGALLYVWSPRMVLSAQHADSARRQAQLYGLRFVPLHDATVPQAELDGALQRLQSPLFKGLAGAAGVAGAATPQPTPPRPHAAHDASANALATSQALCAASLLEREALRHFPTAFVMRASGVHRHPIIGAMPEAAWASSIVQRLKPEAALRAHTSVPEPGIPSKERP